MTIEQTSVVDALGIDVSTNKLHLTISDHLPWDADIQDAHLSLLQEKVNTYLGFIENGEYLEVMPEAEGFRVRIVVIGRYELSERAMDYYSYASEIVSKAGFELVFEHGLYSGDVN